MGKHIIVVIALVASLIACDASPQGRPGVDFRDVPAVSSERLAEVASALIDAIQTSDHAAVRSFIDKYATPQYRDAQPIEARVQQFRTARWRMGDPRLRGERFWKGALPGSYAPIVQDETTGTWWYVDLVTAPTSDVRLTGFTYNSMTAPEFAESSPIDPVRLPGEIERTVRDACARDAFSGAVLVARRAEVLATAVCGEASKTFHVPNSLDTKFSLASMNKMFTALVVMQLVEENRLSLSDNLSGRVDEALLPERVAGRITVAQLLSHRSGVQSLGPSIELAFEPGSQFRYSNSGMALFGSVIEALAGEDYFNAVRHRIYERAAMTSSESYVFDEVVKGDEMVEGFAAPYEFAAEGPNVRFQKSPFLTNAAARAASPRGGPAGGGFSTVSDLHRFAVALIEGELVSTEALAAMWTDYSGFDTGFYGYGYGFEIYQTPEGRVVGHGGSAPGASGRLEINTDTGYVIVVLSNYGTAALPMAKRLTDVLANIEE